MNHLMLFEYYNKKSRKVEKLKKSKLDLQSKFEILLDSIVEVADLFGFVYYDEEDGDWNPPDQPYYEYSYNSNGTIRQINLCNVSMADCEPEEVIYSLNKIKPKLELRSGFKLKIEYLHGEDDFIIIEPDLRLHESFIEDIEIDDSILYKKVPKDVIIRLLYTNGLSIERPTDLEINKLALVGLNKNFIIGEKLETLVYSRGNWVFKLNDDYWLAINNKHCYLCDTIDGLINCPITK